MPLLLQLFAATASPEPTPVPAPDTRPNILVVVLDDMGRDTIGAYGLADAPPPTPVIDELAQLGVRFDRAWAHPICSPSRAALITGKHGFRVGIGNAIPEAEGAFGLQTSEKTLPDLLQAEGKYVTGAFGKWHLAAADAGPTHPNDSGFGHYDGCLTNLDITPDSPWTYTHWPRVVNGVESIEQRYLTSQTITSARSWIDDQTRPWFAYVALHAVHSPFHWPPQVLHSVDPATVPPNELDYWQHRAMVESVDTELGRLIAGLGVDTGETTLLLVSDNGTASPGVEPPFPQAKSKSTLFEGGVSIPMIVAGAGAPTPGVSDGLVHIVDLFATVAELAQLAPDADRSGVDSISLVPYLIDPTRSSLRAFNYAERFRVNGPGQGKPPIESLGSAQPGAPTVCEEDIGFGNTVEPTSLSACGSDGQKLVAGNVINLVLRQAAPSVPGLLLVGDGVMPAPFLDGLIATTQLELLIPFVTDAAGRWVQPLPGQIFADLGPDVLTVQAVSLDPAAPSGNDLSNALFVRIPPFDRKAVVDLDCYKLIATGWGGKEQLFHLPTDPFETQDLLLAGDSALAPDQLAALGALRTELALLLTVPR